MSSGQASSPGLRPGSEGLSRAGGRMAGGTGWREDWLQVPLGEEERNRGKSGKFLTRKPKFGGVQEVACAAGRSRDKPRAREKLSPHPAARLCASRFFGRLICPGGFAEPAAGSADLGPHLFAADRAPSTRRSFSDLDSPAGSARRSGRGALVKRLLRWRFCCNPG